VPLSCHNISIINKLRRQLVGGLTLAL